ncbi:uncharacterized protein PGTG_04613 [Puccinia graminis f. sp. tritici CRL 75-36-700-3]|uniref:Uncharacterized protein n=1 Tax=Puccinia graminis f. sp. tritici (strain CRL 75-36-700-3 / race SCCL) TaxID=418459 RepID=E3K2T8_PUCGT|nr:uncharacterized protein PGTG_04613 [Puccinia graminis f. sp. tritici CRL 75-36-700-3]EFP78657.1 hypothetical protein PGTG_04613 [Puccinia graminis f. sp. tritici CRL 75-36-700-3]
MTQCWSATIDAGRVDTTGIPTQGFLHPVFDSQPTISRPRPNCSRADRRAAQPGHLQRQIHTIRRKNWTLRINPPLVTTEASLEHIWINSYPTMDYIAQGFHPSLHITKPNYNPQATQTPSLKIPHVIAQQKGSYNHFLSLTPADKPDSCLAEAIIFFQDLIGQDDWCATEMPMSKLKFAS